MKTLREIGLNTVYVEVWKLGYTEYPSRTLFNTIGVWFKVNNAVKDEQRDLLQDTLINAHRNGLLHIPWFEYGFMASWNTFKNDLTEKKKEWLTHDINKNYVSKHKFIWMNPFRPEVQQFLLGITRDAIINYDIDGVQFDDHAAYPVEFGYDDYTKDLYKKDTGKDVPSDMNDPDWRNWRKRKLDEFMQWFVREIKKINREFVVSLSPATIGLAEKDFLLDWFNYATWKNMDTFDEFVPQIYRRDFQVFGPELKTHVDAMTKTQRLNDMHIGLRLVGEGNPLPPNEAGKHVELIRSSTNYKSGHSWWYGEAVQGSFASEVRSLYNVPKEGHAPHPHFDADRRPPPIVGKASSRNPKMWSFTGVTPGQYRVIVQRNGLWTQFAERIVRESDFIVFIDSAAQSVELLVDRRPWRYKRYN